MKTRSFIIICAALGLAVAGYVIGFARGRSAGASASPSRNHSFGRQRPSDRGARGNPETAGNDRPSTAPAIAPQADRDARLSAQRAARQQYCAQLIALFNDRTGPPARRLQAVKLLGELRCDSAISTLVENVNWQPRNDAGPPDGHGLILNRFPCAQSLSKFGLTAAPSIISGLARLDEDEVTESLIHVFALLLLKIHGPAGDVNGGPEEAIELIKQTLEISSDDGMNFKKKNVERLLRAIVQHTTDGAR